MFKCVLPKFQPLQGSSLEQLRLVSDRYFFVKTTELGYKRLFEMVDGYECEEFFLEIPGPTGMDYIIVSEKHKFVGWCGEILESSFRHTMNYLGLTDGYPNFMYDVIFNKNNIYRQQSDVWWADELCESLQSNKEYIENNLDNLPYEILTIADVLNKYPHFEEYVTMCMVNIVVNNTTYEKLNVNVDIGEFEDFQSGFPEFYKNNYYIVPLTLINERYKYPDRTKFSETVQKDMVQQWLNLVEQHFNLLESVDGFAIKDSRDLAVSNKAFAHKTIFNVLFMVNFIKQNINDAPYDISLLTVICEMANILASCKHMPIVNELLSTHKNFLDELSKKYQEYLAKIDTLVEIEHPIVF